MSINYIRHSQPSDSMVTSYERLDENTILKHYIHRYDNDISKLNMYYHISSVDNTLIPVALLSICMVKEMSNHIGYIDEMKHTSAYKWFMYHTQYVRDESVDYSLSMYEYERDSMNILDIFLDYFGNVF